MRGVWIEILYCYHVYVLLYCHSPCGECGLKSRVCPERCRGFLSLPMRGVWIEICSAAELVSIAWVTPHAGSVD